MPRYDKTSAELARLATVAACVVISLGLLGAPAAKQVRADTLPRDALERILEGGFKAVDAQTVKREAAGAALAVMERMGEPDVAIIMPKAQVRRHIDDALKKLEGSFRLGSHSIDFEPGGIGFAVQGFYAESGIEIDATVSGLFTAKVEAENLHLLPVITELDIEEIDFGDSMLDTIAEATAKAVLPRITAQLSGALIAALDPISLKMKPLGFDLAEELKKQETLSEISAPKFTIEPRIGDAAIVIENDRLIVLATEGSSPASQNMETTSPAEAARAATRVLDAFVGDGLRSGGVAVSRAAVYAMLNGSLKDLRPVARARLRGPTPERIPFNEKIELGKRPNFDCAPTRNCTQTRDCTPRRNCTQDRNCDLRRDTRNCSACIVRNPFGGCTIRGNDPLCEARKAAANADYARLKAQCEATKSTEKAGCEAQKSAEKAACESEKTAARLDCERLKSTEVAQCELKKQVQNALAELGGVGNVSGDFTASYDMRLELTAIVFTRNLDSVIVAAKAGGQVNIGGRLTFVPYDVLGHLACAAKWSRPVSADITLPMTSLTASARLTSGTEPTLQVSIPRQTVTPKSRPLLDMLFDRNPDLRIVCPGLQTIDLADDALKTITGKRAHPILAGDYEIDIDPIEIVEPVPPLQMTIAGRALTMHPVLAPEALIFRLSQ